MSTFKHNKGKLVEQPIQGKPFKIICVKAYEFEGREFKVGDISESSWGYNVPDNWVKMPPRQYIAEGFAEDELVEEKDLGLVCRYGKHCYTLGTHECQYIARKLTNPKKDDLKKFFKGLDEFHQLPNRVSEEGEKSETMNQLDLQTFKDAYIERNDAYNKAIQEIKRLKGLIKEGFVLLQKEWGKEPEQIKIDWKIFEAENNLT